MSPTSYKFSKDCNMSRSRICFLEGLPTITSIVEGFGGVPSYNVVALWLLQYGVRWELLSVEGTL